MRPRLIACLLVVLGLLLLTGSSMLLHAGKAGTLIGESLAVLLVIVVVTALSLRNSGSSQERSKGWLRAGGAYLFVCVLIVAVGVLGDRSAGIDTAVPSKPEAAGRLPVEPPTESPGASRPPAGNIADADQIKALLGAFEVRNSTLQEKYRNLLSPSYFVRLLAPENLADSAKVRQARFLLARLADSADSYAVEIASESKVLVEQIQSVSLSAESKTRYTLAVQQVALAQQQDVDRWMAAKRASIATALGILTLIEQADNAVVAQDDRIAFVDRTAGERYEILVEQLRSQDARARSALRAVTSRDQQMREALAISN